MSNAVMESIIGRAIMDIEFRFALLADPDQALAPFNLSPADKASLKRLDDESLEFLARILNARLMRGRRDGSLFE
jgi:hypothetical protein